MERLINKLTNKEAFICLYKLFIVRGAWSKGQVPKGGVVETRSRTTDLNYSDHSVSRINASNSQMNITVRRFNWTCTRCTQPEICYLVICMSTNTLQTLAQSEWGRRGHGPRGVTRLDGARCKKQVWCAHVATWSLSQAKVLYWRKYLWHYWYFSGPPQRFGAPIVIWRPDNCALLLSLRYAHAWLPDTIDTIFIGALYQILTFRKYAEGTVGPKMTSVTDDVYDWPLPNKIIGCATSYKLFI